MRTAAYSICFEGDTIICCDIEISWYIAFIHVVAPKGAVCFVKDCAVHFMLALRGFGGPTECPWA